MVVANTGFGADQKQPGPQTFPIVQTDEGPRILAFGLLWPIQDDISLHLNCFRMGLRKDQGGLGKVRHLVEAHNLIWPNEASTLHEWTIKRFKTFCEGHQVVTMAGGGGCSKSYDAAKYALLWWWANPTQRAVLIGSTTIGALQKRIWSYIQEFFYKAQGNLPGLPRTSPTPMVLFSRQDSKHGIHAVALKQGAAENTLRDIIGIHPAEGLLAVIDEATDVTPAITEAITNWDSGGVNFQMIAIGNSKSRLDPHGVMSKPKRGWNSVDPDLDDEWETELGKCLFFDCYRSPAIVSPSKERFPFLINERQIRAKEKALGKDDPKFWRFVRGFWPPEDLMKTVLTLSLVENHKAAEPAEWSGDWQVVVAGLDPAFTSEGDECILRFATMGVMSNGRVGLDFGGDAGIVSLKLDSREKEPINYQIARLARAECEARGVDPEYFGVDSWGFGSGAGDIFEREWSEDIHKIVGITVPSERYVDSEAAEIAKDAYMNAITEYWFAMRTFVQSGQIRGLDDITIEEFCSRLYKWQGRKVVLEGKKEFKSRMGREDSPTGSPDRADAAVIVLEVARRMGFMPNSRNIHLDERFDYESRWERQRGLAAQMEAEREEAWMGDPILDSMAFSESWGDE